MQFDLAIIGGGIVGLATALRLSEAREGRSPLRIVVFEKETAIASHQTGHNSGVIHSGIYYTPGSLKARNCRAGYQQLLNFCEENGVPYRLCGKVIVATHADEVPALERIYERGLANGLERIQKIGPAALQEIEPHARGVAAIQVPYAGIVDYRVVCETYARLFQEAGGEIRHGTRVTAAHKSNDGKIVLQTISSDGRADRGKHNHREREVTARMIINCAGLHSDTVAESCAQDTGARIDYRILPFRGEYYKLRPERRHLVRSLIYPVPDPAFPFLGVHFTSMMDGGVEAGPNAVFALKKEGYRWSDISPRDVLRSCAWPGFRSVARRYWRTGLAEMHRSFSKAAFTRALQKLIPEIQSEDLVPGGAGVRAQACARYGGLIDDFYFHEDGGLLNVGNAPSPAATSSLAIGRHIAERALARLAADE
ncbi:MAG: L-2-hydroxyglutarate oxidase [bacterium]|nr:L-2-hydroxyglutarate oxidase [bacterium]